MARYIPFMQKHKLEEKSNFGLSWIAQSAHALCRTHASLKSQINQELTILQNLICCAHCVFTTIP